MFLHGIDSYDSQDLCLLTQSGDHGVSQIVHRFSPMAVVCLSFSRGHLKPQITVNGQMQTYRSEDILSDTLEFKKFVHLDRQL
jgi:hypothetical protein